MLSLTKKSQLLYLVIPHGVLILYGSDAIFKENRMLYHSESMKVSWEKEGIAKLVFDAQGAINKLDAGQLPHWMKPLPALNKHRS